MDLSSLERFAETVKVSTWQPVTHQDLAPGMVLAFDQSLSSTGWVVLVVDSTGTEIRECGTLKNEGDPLKGSARSLARFSEMIPEVTRVLIVNSCATVVHENPPAASSVSRPESSLLAAAAIHAACAERGNAPHSVQAQHAKKVVTGNGNARKPDVASAVKALTWIRGVDRLKNEHQRDALAIALTFLVDKKAA